MKFVGELNDKMKGFYRSKYKDLNGEEKHCAVTQFEVFLSVFPIEVMHCSWMGFKSSITATVQ